jgi:hypothetical protein
MRDPDWVEVRRCGWVHEAHVLASVLEASGIECRIPDEFTLAIQPFYTHLLGGVRILVRTEDSERARELLDSPPGLPPGADPDGGSA